MENPKPRNDGSKGHANTTKKGFSSTKKIEKKTIISSPSSASRRGRKKRPSGHGGISNGAKRRSASSEPAIANIASPSEDDRGGFALATPEEARSFVGPTLDELPPEMLVVILLMLGPKEVIDMCLVSSRFMHLCYGTEITVAGPRGCRQRKTLREHALSFHGCFDVRKYLLYLWYLMLTAGSGGLCCNWEICTVPYFVRRARTRGLRVDWNYRWAKDKITGHSPLLSYESVSRNDLLYWVSTPAEHLEEDRRWVKGAIRQFALFVDRIGRDMSPQTFILLGGPWFDDSRSDVLELATPDAPYRSDGCLVYPLHGSSTDTPRKVHFLGNVDPLGRGLLTPRLVTQKRNEGATPQEIYSLLRAFGFEQAMKEVLHGDAKESTDRFFWRGSRELPDEDRVFFDYFDADLYVAADERYFGYWEGLWRVFGLVRVRPEDIHPYGTNYWEGLQTKERK